MSSSNNRVNYTEPESPQDHISELPNDVVAHILSLLPTKHVVKTSVLSRNWRFKWTSIYNIDIDEPRPLYEHTIAGFITFVSRILLGTGDTRIRRFHLSCTGIYMEALDAWISQILTRGAENIKIVAPRANRSGSWVPCTFNRDSLKSLSLSLRCTLIFPLNNCFPNLKKLSLAGIRMEQIHRTDRMILRFPILQVLVLKHCSWLDVNFVEIHAPEMSILETCFEKGLQQNIEIEIFGPKLAMFEWSGSSVNNFVLHAPAVSCAYHSFLQGRIHTLLGGFPDLVCLKLRSVVLQDLLLLWKLELTVPAFPRLKELDLSSYPYPIKCVLKLLQLLPSVEILRNVNLSVNTYEKRKPLPPRFLSNLKKVELAYFLANDVAFYFSKLILENARNLKEMHVFLSSTSCMGKAEVSRRLSKLPKSSSCNLIVKGMDEWWERYLENLSRSLNN